MARRTAEMGSDDHVAELEQRISGVAGLAVKGVENVTYVDYTLKKHVSASSARVVGSRSMIC